MTEDEFDRHWKRRYGLLYQIELSNLYHRKRERFYDWMDRGGKAAAIIGGSAAFARLSDAALPYVAAAIAGSSAFSLVWSFSERARKHGELARQFCELGAELARVGETSFTDQDLNEWDAKIRVLESNEPASLRALVLICQNDLATARRATTYPLNWFKRWTAQIVNWNVQLPKEQVG